MSTELKFDKRTATNLLATVPRMKPKGVARVYHLSEAFTYEGEEFGADSALVLTPGGDVLVIDGVLVDSLFEPVAKKKTKPKGE